MQKIGRIGMRLIMIILFLFPFSTQAQSKKYFVITGKIVPEAEGTGTGTIEITKNDKETSTIQIPKNGRFRFELEFFNEYSLNFKYPGHFNKIITVSTEIPQEVWERDNDFPPFPMIVQLYKEIDGIDKSFTLKASGRIFYGKDIDNFEKESFMSDLQILEQVTSAKAQANQVNKEAQSISKENAQDLAAKQKDFDQLIKEADAHYQRGEYQMALMKYLEAHRLFPEKAYPNDRVAELQDLVKALEITEKQKADLEKKYQDAIARANGFFDKKSYPDARPVYEEALQYKPGDVFANGRINEIDQLLALMEKQKQYKDLIAQADENYKSKKYDQAITLYNQAKSAVPEDQYADSQIALINQERQAQAKQDQLEKDFSMAMQTGDTKAQQKDYLNALATYKKALELKPDSKLAKDKIAEAEQAMAALETDKKYQQAIQLADQAFAAKDFEKARLNYQQALNIKGNESYPNSKLAEIKAAEASEIEFNNLIAKAEKDFTAANFDVALNEYNQALAIKPQDAQVKKRIDDIQNLKKQQQTDKDYTDLIAQADQAFNDGKYDDAVNGYNKALQIKKSEAYPKDQLQKIDSYQSLIKKADKSFNSSDYDAAKQNYQSALAAIPADLYASGKVSEIDKILDARKQQEEQAKAQLLAYDEAVKNADQLFDAKSYTESLTKYQEASNMKASEAYPKKRIKEIESILDGLAKEKARQDKEYQSVIAQADKLFEKQDLTNAKSEYNKALSIKSEETYPKDQINKIDQTLAENKRKAEENLRAQQAKVDQDFNRAMADADKAFDANDFNSAKSGYEAALNIKPDDAQAKTKLGQTDAKLAQIAKMNQAYNTAIAAANKQLTDKHYPEAKEKYQEALQYLPNEDYPKNQITKIDELLAQQASELKLQQDFTQALAEGESLLKNKELAKAKDAFMKAYNLIPSEPVPPKRISEINDLLAAQQKKESEIKATQEAYQKAIQRADAHFGNKEYSSARLVYNEALMILPNEKYPVDQLALIERLLKEQDDQNYKTAIAKADNAFDTNLFDDATKSYNDALKIRKDDKYATDRLKEIVRKQAELAAEKERLKKLDDQYNAILAAANSDFRNKQYQDAKDKYQNALSLKPDEVYPKDQIAKINQLLGELSKAEELNQQYEKYLKEAEAAFNDKKLKEARDLYQKGYNLKPFEAVPPMRIAQIDAMLAKQDELAQLAAQEEAQRLAKEKADRLAYNNAVAEGDKAFADKIYKVAILHYGEALTALPAEKYPKDQIDKCKELMAQEEMDREIAMQKAQQDSLLKVKDRLFDVAMNSAKAFNQNQQYNEAIQKYNEAIGIKPDQKPNVQKFIQEIEDKLQLMAKQDADYKRLIALADDSYTQSRLPDALSQYSDALKIKPEEAYPKSKINEIQAMLAARDKSYNDAIARADKAFDASDWANAKTSYTEALGVKPDEVYPANRLKETNQKIADANLAAQSNSAEDKAYKDAIEKGEQALKNDQLSAARMQFQVAKTMKPDEKLPAEKIAEIDKLLDQRNKDRLAAAQRELDDKYKQALSLADNSFREKSYSIAKLQYQQALLIKPEESYPKSQMALIDKLMKEAKPVETYAYKLPEIETVKPAAKPALNVAEAPEVTESRAQNFALVTDYSEALKKADESFGIQDYSVARFYYYKASDIRPNEQYPKDQIEKIRKLIDSQLSSGDLSAYDQAINNADKAFSNQNYSVAKFYYYKALDIKSWEQYPKDRIEEILRLTNSLLSEREEKEYRDMIAKADEAYFDKDIAVARFYYFKAIAIKRDENYPHIKLADIQKLIDQDAEDQKNQEYQKLIDQGDQALQAGNYSIARFNYNKALGMKPNEKYPKDQLKRIKEALDSKNN